MSVKRYGKRRGRAALLVLSCGMALACAPHAQALEAPADAGPVQLAARAVQVQLLDARASAYEPDQIIVVYKDAPAASDAADDAVSTLQGETAQVIAGDAPDAPDALDAPDAGAAATAAPDAPVAASLVTLSGSCSVGEAVVAAQDDPNVAFAQPNYRYKPLWDNAASAAASTPLLPGAPSAPRSVMPNDPVAHNKVNDKDVQNQWWLASVRAPEAWEYARCEHDVTVAVLDTGINFQHEDLADNILTDYAWDAVKGQKLTESPRTSALSHGSHVAGIVSACADNGVGIAGASYNASILPIAVFQASGGEASCDDATLIKAYDYLLSDPAPEDGLGKSVIERTNLHVINMSLGGYGGEDEALRRLIAKAQDKGVLTVAAAGNGDDAGNPLNTHSYPSDYDEVLSVVALKDDVERSHWSDYNECKDLAAPGVDIWSTWYTGNDYYCTSGTSMAAPLVSGCAALLWKYDPDLTVQQVKDALCSTAVDLGQAGRDDYYGWGRIDVAAAIESLGTAHITAQRQVMGRTGVQQLHATDVRDPEAQHEWVWSVSDPTVASITPQGELHALTEGSVVVQVAAADDAAVCGHIGITVTEIRIPSAVTCASDGVKHTVTLEWDAADAAVRYDVRRANASAGPYQTVASVAAEAGRTTYRFEDADVAPNTRYYYAIVPVGRIGEADAEGASTAVVEGYFTDKTALGARMDEAEALVASAIVSADGADVAAGESWTTQEALDELKAEIERARKLLASTSARQATVDVAAAKLASAVEKYRSALHQVPGGTQEAEDPKDPEGPEDQPRPPKKTNVALANPLRVKAKAVTVKLGASAKKLKRSKTLQISGAKGALSFAKKGASKLKLNAKTGTITVPKGCKRGVYSITVRVRAAGDANHLPATRTVKVKVKVKAQAKAKAKA